MLKVEGLNAGYGSVNILWDIGFTLDDGEIVAILGSNGDVKAQLRLGSVQRGRAGQEEFQDHSSHRDCPGTGGKAAVHRHDGSGESPDGSLQ